MALVRRRDMPQSRAAQRIVKILAEGTYVHRPDEVFDGWLEIVNAALESLPTHAASVFNSGKMAADPAEVKALWKRIEKRFGASIVNIYQRAFQALLDASQTEEGEPVYEDLLGDIYMAWAWPNSHMGQFFTPMPVARMMAQMTMPKDRAEAEIYQHLTDAYLKSPEGSFHKLLLGRKAAKRIPAFVRELGPNVLAYCARYYEPIKVSDCCCGSGVMLLAAAAQYPPWAVGMGLVQFYGQDLDATCVLMCKINCMIYGLNGYSLKCEVAMSGVEVFA